MNEALGACSKRIDSWRLHKKDEGSETEQVQKQQQKKKNSGQFLTKSQLPWTTVLLSMEWEWGMLDKGYQHQQIHYGLQPKEWGTEQVIAFLVIVQTFPNDSVHHTVITITCCTECFLWAREELLVLFIGLVLMYIGRVHDSRTIKLHEIQLQTVAVSELTSSLNTALYGRHTIEHWSW